MKNTSTLGRYAVCATENPQTPFCVWDAWMKKVARDDKGFVCIYKHLREAQAALSVMVDMAEQP